ncbi:MAG: hypothetical protein FJX46_08420 [Alphaproteobacteria bacterium]|nr:hypothetical protein [Alphaproteobacteria bacterium]
MSGGHPLHVVVPIWGEAYLGTYFDLVLPCHAAAGNLPALKAREASLYRVFTRAADRDRIAAHPLIRRIGEYMPLAIDPIDDMNAGAHAMMSESYRRGLVDAAAKGAALAPLTGDNVFSDGTLPTLEGLAAAGRSTALVIGIRTWKPSVVPALEAFRAADGSLPVPARALAGIGIAHLHPALLAEHRFDAGAAGESLHPSMLNWPVGRDGLLVHCFHLHPFMLRPQRDDARFGGTVDDDMLEALCPDPAGDHIVADSDELMMIELSDALREMVTGVRKGSVADAVRWALAETGPRQAAHFAVPIRLHAGPLESAHWAPVEARARGVVGAILAGITAGQDRLWLRDPATALRRLLKHAQRHAVAAGANTPLSRAHQIYVAVANRLLTSRRRFIARRFFTPGGGPWNALWRLPVGDERKFYRPGEVEAGIRRLAATLTEIPLAQALANAAGDAPPDGAARLIVIDGAAWFGPARPTPPPEGWSLTERRGHAAMPNAIAFWLWTRFVAPERPAYRRLLLWPLEWLAIPIALVLGHVLANGQGEIAVWERSRN